MTNMSQNAHHSSLSSYANNTSCLSFPFHTWPGLLEGAIEFQRSKIIPRGLLAITDSESRLQQLMPWVFHDMPRTITVNPTYTILEFLENKDVKWIITLAPYTRTMICSSSSFLTYSRESRHQKVSNWGIRRSWAWDYKLATVLAV